jgi:hypothetical protein
MLYRSSVSAFGRPGLSKTSSIFFWLTMRGGSKDSPCVDLSMARAQLKGERSRMQMPACTYVHAASHLQTPSGRSVPCIRKRSDASKKCALNEQCSPQA